MTTDSDDRRPARGYSWAPFEDGNQVSLRHGATSPRAIAERADQIHAELLRHAPYLDTPKFLPAVRRYLDAAAVEGLLQAHVVKVSAEQGTGKVASRTWEQLTAARRLAAKLGSDLGLDPIGHARIRALSAGAEATEASLADLAAEGRRIRLATAEASEDAETEEVAR